ncbi:MAG TPA: DUF1385 domain-containing protein [Anaerolineaceae bacterium]|jgi:uncharacterized protein YqhQ|nr:DUF1385 domain-containing protein [Anaerolineaceae bacterium]
MTGDQKELRLPSYGGQAVMEGVMMRGKQHVAMAVRAPDGQILTYEEQLPALYRSKWMSIPFLRGVLGLWDSLNLGMRFLTKSSNMVSGKDEQIEGKDLVLTVLLSLVLGIGFFFLLPALITGWLDGPLGIEGLGKLGTWLSNLIEGLFRLAILIVYLVVVGRMPEIRRVFSYHGAEHKTINAFEAGAELTPKNVSEFTLVHPRCGTSFMLTLVLISILFFSLLGPLALHWRLLTRLLLLPVVSGLAYEYIRFAARHMDDSALMRALIKPNLALQKLTTREPSEDMLEVSIKAFNLMYEAEQKGTEGIPA